MMVTVLVVVDVLIACATELVVVLVTVVVADGCTFVVTATIIILHLVNQIVTIFSEYQTTILQY